MACYYPLKARFRTRAEVIDGITHGISAGKLRQPIVKGSNYDGDLSPVLDVDTGEYQEWFDLGCGQCIGCRLAYSREWANRNVLESLCYDEDRNKFLTLTYSNDTVPVGSEGNLTTKLDDISDFMKRLRRYYEYNYNHYGIRFFAASEYGGDTFRPHYHASLFNLVIPDLKKIANNVRGDCLYTSDLINKIWGKGFVVIGDFSWNTAAYTARYMVKKLKGKDASLEYQALGLEPECTRMSRRPGIGIEWINRREDWMDIYNTDEIVLPSNSSKVNAVKPPKSFDMRLKDADPIRYAKIKENRSKAAELSLKAKLDATGYTKNEYFSIAEMSQEAKNKKLLRIFQDLS